MSGFTACLVSNGRKISPNTVGDYVEALTESFIFYPAERFDIVGKQLLKANRKMHIVDLGLRNHILPCKNYDLGFSLENLVYFELLRRGYKVTIGKGEICVILGPSGSGKSTILNMLGGLDTPDSGELTIGGRSLIGLTPKERTLYRKEEVGFVFQFYNLIPDLTVEENIEAVSDISESPLDLNEVLGALELEPYRRRFPRELSGGQQQRAATARAMIKNPRLLLCDELTGALDTRSSKNVLRFVEKMNRKYGTRSIWPYIHFRFPASLPDRDTRGRRLFDPAYGCSDAGRQKQRSSDER